MKNVLGSNEFKQLRELQMITEDMDFSNRTGWSESLIGRAVNKMFSFAKVKMQTLIMKKLKNRLDDEYMKALLLTMDEFGLSKEQVSTEVKDDVIEDIINKDEQGALGEATVKEETEISIKKFVAKKEKALEYQSVFVRSLTGKMKSESVSADNKALLQHVNVRLVKEIEQVKDENSLSILNKMKEDIDNILGAAKGEEKISDDEYKEKITNYEKENSLRAKRLKEAKKIYDELKPKLSDEESIKALDKAFKTLESFLGSGREDAEMDAGWEKFKELVKKLDKSVQFVTESLDNDLINELNDFSSLLEAQMAQKKPKVKTIKDMKLKKLINKSDKNKKVLDIYGDMNVVEFDPYKGMEIIEKEGKTKEFRTKLIGNVNKEALKEIQLRAEWMYDTEKYEDKRNAVYSRVNFSTTHPDMSKLKNKWFKMIASIKSKYSPFFSDKVGNFPKDLDPPALVASDKRFRDTWNQYDANTINSKDPGLNGSNSNLADDEIDRLYCSKKDKVGPGNYGILDSKTNDTDFGLPFGLIVYAHKIENIAVYEIHGLYDTVKIAEETKTFDKEDKAKIKEVIAKNTYTRRDPKFEQLKSNETLYKIFQTFVYTIRDDAEKYKKDIAAGLVYPTLVDESSTKKHMLYLVKASNEEGEEKNFIGVHDKNNPDNNHIINVNKAFSTEYKDLEILKPIFYYNFYIKRSCRILDNDVWSLNDWKPSQDKFSDVGELWKIVKDNSDHYTSHEKNVQS